MTDARRIGFLADTHSNKSDGSDLPDKVLKAFEGVDLIVHLGDIGRKGIIGRLSDVAPVMVPVGGNKGYLPATQTGDKGAKVLEAGDVVIGLIFNLVQPDKKIEVGETITLPDEPLAPLLKRRFGRDDVKVVAHAGTHQQRKQTEAGVLFFDPGSPTLPMPGKKAGVAVLDVSGKKPAVKLVSWS